MNSVRLENLGYRTSKQIGQSILEVIVAMAIFSLIIVAIISMVTGSFIGLTQGGEQTQAEALAEEGVEAVKAIYNEAWNQLTYTTSSVSIAGEKWIFDGEGTTETIGQFTRTINFADVCRDSSEAIVSCPGSYKDVHSKEVTATVTWETRNSVSNTVKRVGYITNWDSREWAQTDWSGGSSQSIWSDIAKYDSDDSNVSTTASSGSVVLLSDVIENGDFEDTTSNWSFGSWDVGVGETAPTGSHLTTGGNQDGYVNISHNSLLVVSSLGGYWEQSFVAQKDNPSATKIDFDFRVFTYSGIFVVSDIRVYIDSSSGPPVNQVGGSVSLTGTTGSWSGIAQIDGSSAVSTSGTYYLKIGVRIENTASALTEINVGIDNVVLDLGDGEYKTSGELTSSAFNMSNNSPVQAVEWDETIPTCSPVCKITVDVSTAPDSGGSPGTWTSWQNSATSTGVLLPTSLNGNQWVRYKANLTGNGDDTPVLKELRVNYK